MRDFAAIDFETANNQRSSVCSVGVVVVRDGEIADTFYSLINPEPNYYTYWCSQVHGLTREDTEDAPVFPAVWAQIEPLIEGLPLVAHNRPFDESCLKAVFRVYQMDYPDYEFYDTLCVARRVFPELPNHQLHTVAAACGYRLSSEEVEAAFSQALTACGAEVRSLPMSDGGEGMLPAFITALHGQLLQAKVHDPLMRPVTACYGIAPDGTAVIETAQACGLTYLSAEERNPLVATTYGVGELVAHAVRHGCRRFLIGLGGSGTSDAGKGMLQGLTDSLAPGGTIEDVLNGPLSDCHFILASDVRNPLYGPEGAAHIFAPQKGATPEMVEELDRRARQFAEESVRRMGRDASFQPGAGAAGGLGYAFLQYLQATTQSGADLLLDLCEFDTLLTHTDLVITGEGHADRQTLMGKLPERVMRRAQAQHVPVWLVAGKASDTESLVNAGFSRVDSLTPDGMPLEEAIRPEVARENIRQWVETVWNQLKK